MMNNKFKKAITVVLTLAAIMSTLSFAFTANASQTYGAVRVVIENTKYSAQDGAVWDGTLLDETVNLDADTTMLSAVKTALDKYSYTQTGIETNYITEINGLGTYDGGSMSGWVVTLNDWFTNEGADAYTVSSGKLSDGDEIKIMYSLDYGADCGSHWDNNDNSLSSITFSDGTLNKDFSSSSYSYNLTLADDVTEISLNPTAANKNYQVRIYKNEYTPDKDGSDYKRSEKIQIESGDKIIIGVGDPAWPSMNLSSDALIYTITITKDSFELGDVNRDNNIDINDVTSIQKYIALSETFDDEQLSLADFDGNGIVDIQDVTSIQKAIAKIN